MKCNKCGAQLPDNAKFCRECGEKVTVPEIKTLFCRECGRKLEPGSKFCPGCGSPVKDLPMPQSEEIEVTEEESNPQASADTAPEIPFWERPVTPKEDKAAIEETSESMAPPPLPDSSNEFESTPTNNAPKVSPEIVPEPNKFIEFIKGISKQAFQRFMEFWTPLSKYAKIITCVLVILVVSSLVAFCSGHPFPGIIAMMQIALVVISWLMYLNKIKEPKPNVKKYLLIVAVLLLLPYFLSYGISKSNSSNQPVITKQEEKNEPVPMVTERTESPFTTETETEPVIIETTVPVLVGNSPDLYFGTWKFNTLEADGKTVHDGDLDKTGNSHLRDFRVVFRFDGSGCIYEQSGKTEFNWKINPYGINSDIFTGSIADDTLILLYPDRKLFLVKESDNQGIPVIYRTQTETEPSVDVKSTEETSESTDPTAAPTN